MPECGADSRVSKLIQSSFRACCLGGSNPKERLLAPQLSAQIVVPRDSGCVSAVDSSGVSAGGVKKMHPEQLNPDTDPQPRAHHPPWDNWRWQKRPLWGRLAGQARSSSRVATNPLPRLG